MLVDDRVSARVDEGVKVRARQLQRNVVEYGGAASDAGVAEEPAHSLPVAQDVWLYQRCVLSSSGEARRHAPQAGRSPGRIERNAIDNLAARPEPSNAVLDG